MDITLLSFGFKHGQPQADLLWDVRFLPNPYWVPELRPYPGTEAKVAHYVLAHAAGERFLALLEPLLAFLLEEYAAKGRETLIVAVGCTGGRHRSVAVVERLRAVLEARRMRPRVAHRDIGKE